MLELPHYMETSVQSDTPDAPTDGLIGMQAFVENGIFGWLHIDKARNAADVAVLICGAVSREALDSHHSLRVLADDFAVAGYPAMRFDYHGSGDSADLPQWAEKPNNHWAIWQQNIGDAADYLRRITGARRLILCGLRIGATLAALTAERREDIAGLILLAPVLRGRSYLRQLQVQGALKHDKASAKRPGLEFHELQLDPQTVEVINGVDLRHTGLGERHKVAIFAESESRLLSDCVSAWNERGAITECYSFEGLEPLLSVDTQGYTVPAASAGLIDWMHRAVPNEDRMRRPDQASFHPMLQLQGCTETPLHFGREGRLFGIICQPETRVADTAVIIVNTGRSPRWGVGRFGTEFARRLAVSGIASLRLDFAGLGDSIGPAGEENLRSDVFEKERTPDISAAIDLLEQLGYHKFAIHGICSGAYHALHATAADPRIKAILMINLPLFLWRAGDSITDAKHRSYALGHYARGLGERMRWRRLLTGQSDISGILRNQILRLKNSVLRRGADKPGNPGMPDPNKFARKMMTQLSRQCTKTLFLFAPDHAGTYEIQSLFGKGGAGLSAYPGTQIQLVPGLGEAVAESSARETASRIMIGFLETL